MAFMRSPVRSRSGPPNLRFRFRRTSSSIAWRRNHPTRVDPQQPTRATIGRPILPKAAPQRPLLVRPSTSRLAGFLEFFAGRAIAISGIMSGAQCLIRRGPAQVAARSVQSRPCSYDASHLPRAMITAPHTKAAMARNTNICRMVRRGCLRHEPTPMMKPITSPTGT
jgi:hypothetical protein